MLGVVQVPYLRLREQLTDLARRRRDARLLPPGTDPAAVGTALFSLLPGFLMQRLLLGGVDLDGYVAGVRALLAESGG